MPTLEITPELERDVNRLAEVTGFSPAEAVARAVRSKLSVLDPPDNPSHIDLKALDAFLERIRGPVDYSLTEDEILGYDESGAPEQPWLDGRR